MSIVEYPPGARFPGVIGRTTDESTPAWPAAPRPARARRTCSSSCSTTPGSVSSAATAARSRRRPSTRSPPAGLRYNNMHTTALCSPSRSCIVTGRNHHANGMAAITELASGYPGYDGVMPFENGLPVRDAAGARLQHLHGRQVAPDAEQPGDRRRALRPLAARPRLRAVLRLPRRRHQPVVPRPRLRQPPGRAAPHARGGLPPHRGPGRQVDRSSSPTPSRSTRTSPSTCTCASARPTRPHHVPKEWADKYAGKFDDGWDAYREQVFARQKELGIVPADAELSRHDPDVPDWDSLLRRRPAPRTAG